MIRITSKSDGFRRAGIAHPAAPTDYPDDAFTKFQLSQLKAEPMLVVEEIKEAAKGAKAENSDPAKPAAKGSKAAETDATNPDTAKDGAKQ